MLTVADQAAPLALDGGEPVIRKPLPTWPHFDDEQLAVVDRVLRSGKVNYWTGDEGRQFEREYAAAVGVDHAVVVANGTVSLELALHAVGIERGDEVIVPSRTFIATASACVMRGATPIFADIHPVSGDICAETITPLITPRTKAVIVVHMAGRACEMDPIMDLAQHHNLAVIEDCAQAHGATYKGRPVGSIGHVGSFSFCQDKIITTGGEGGLIATNDETLWKRAWGHKDHGKGWDTVYNTQHEGVFRWLHDSVGTNWRMTEMQAAIGRVALRRLPAWIEARRRNASLLADALLAYPAIELLTSPTDRGCVPYKMYASLKLDHLRPGWTRDRVVLALQAEGVRCGSGSCCEIYLEQGIQNAGLAPATHRVQARQFGERSLMFECHPTMNFNHIQLINSALGKVLSAATIEVSFPARVAA